jgi:hypothetical protein
MELLEVQWVSAYQNEEDYGNLVSKRTVLKQSQISLLLVVKLVLL